MGSSGPNFFSSFSWISFILYSWLSLSRAEDIVAELKVDRSGVCSNAFWRSESGVGGIYKEVLTRWTVCTTDNFN
jgi:hypothetical protein